MITALGFIIVLPIVLFFCFVVLAPLITLAAVVGSLIVAVSVIVYESLIGVCKR